MKTINELDEMARNLKHELAISYLNVDITLEEHERIDRLIIQLEDFIDLNAENGV